MKIKILGKTIEAKKINPCKPIKYNPNWKQYNCIVTIPAKDKKNKETLCQMYERKENQFRKDILKGFKEFLTTRA